MKKTIPPYNVINWNFNSDDIEVYDIMPYLVSCWKEEKKRKHKIWNYVFDHELKANPNMKKPDDTVMPQTFEEFKMFILREARHQYWARCEYEVIVTGWPQQKNDKKIDIFYQIEKNIDVITKHFMDYINS